MHQRQLGCLAFSTDSPEWRTFMDASAPAIAQHLSEANPLDPECIPALHQRVSHIFHSCFPAQPTQTRDATAAVHPVILDKWRHREHFKRFHLPNTRNVIRAWFHLARFQALRRQHKKHAFLVRAQRFEAIMEQAQRAAAQHDSFKLFQVINRFAPKAPKRRVQIRTDEGTLATPLEEMNILHRFVADTWKGPATVPKPCPMTMTPGLPFTEHELAQALRDIPVSRAVARPFTPGFIWHAHSMTLAPFLFQLLQQLWDTPHPTIPDCWRDAWLLLIPKPLKKACSPDALRPLALQEPLGKATIGLLAQLAQTMSISSLVHWPIWAYLPGRSTQHALRRVAAHCVLGRQLVASQKPAVMHRFHSFPMFKICGAIQLFLDLRKAFDSICRQELFGRLGEVLDHPKIVQLLACWHECTSYHVESHGGTHPVRVGAGVRQGCKAAPWLFNAFVLLYLRDLAHQIDWRWLQEHLDVYADDFHVHGLFHSHAELKQLLFFFGILMEVLQEKGLMINTTKSAILLTMGGTNFRPVRQALTFRTDAGEWIKIKGRSQTFVLPVVKQTKYLGTLISYSQFEDATVKHRTGLAHTAFHRLKKWLTARRGLDVHARMRLWTTCVYPIMTYGIFCIGLTASGLQNIQATMTSMIRQIHHDHAYMTGRSHAQAFQFHAIDPPLVWLWHSAASLHRSVTKIPKHPFMHDIANLIDWTPVLQVMDFIQHQHTSGLTALCTMVSNEEAETCLACPHCAFTTTTLPVLRQHLTHAHGITRYRRYIHNPSQFMQDGLPICNLCHTTFTTWRTFMIHVQRGCQADTMEHRLSRPLVPFPDQPASPTVPQTPGQVLKLTKEEIDSIYQREFGPRLLTLIHQKRWPDLLRERAGCGFLGKHCLLCGQYVGRAQAMHHHVRAYHNAYSSLVQAKATQLTNMHSDETPCSACGVMFLNTHSCNVWFQVSMLIVHGPKPAAERDTPSHDPLRCEICDLACDTVQALHEHLQRDHHLVSSVWHESRDSFLGQPVCNHCHAMFQSMEGLRSHINQGRCKQFNPDLTTAPTEVCDTWKDACCKGLFEEVLHDPRNRQRLTLRCQCCPKSYSRAADLSAHLQSCHPDVWAAAQPVVYLLAKKYLDVLGCVCNPQCNVVRIQHLCLPLLQLTMQLTRIPRAIFMPAKLNSTELARTLPHHVPADLRDTLEQALLRYDLGATWHDALLLDALSGTCFFCGCDLLPTELTYHLHEAHDGMHPVVKMYVAQLTPHALSCSDNDCACFACGQILQLPADQTNAMQGPTRQKLVQAHLRAQCPSVLQLSILLSHVHYGAARLANEPRGCGRTDAANLQGPGAVAGSQPEAGAKSRSTKKTKATTRSGRCKKQRTAQQEAGTRPGSTDHPDNDGEALASGGQRPAGASARNHIHFLLQLPRTDGSSPPTSQGCRLLAPAVSGEIITVEDASETGPGSDPDVRSPNQSLQADGSSGRLAIDPGGQEVQHLDGEQVDSLCGMELTGTQAPALQPDPGLPDQDVPALHRVAGGISRCEPHHEVSCAADEGGQPGHPLAPTDVSQGGPDLRAHAPPGQFPGLDTPRSQSQETQLAPELFGHQLGAKPRTEATEGPREGEDEDQIDENDSSQTRALNLSQAQLVDIVAKMSLANPSNWCFCNAAVYSLCWTLLSLHTYEPAFWGTQRNDIMTFLHAADSNLCSLATHKFFRDIMRCWERDETGMPSASISQHDSSEFVQVWLSLLQAPTFQMQWEKRVDLADATHVMDSSRESHTPPCLRFDDFNMLAPFCSLNALVTTWHQADGMQTALLQASACICVHIDRCVLGSDLNVHKCTSKLQIDEECFFPVFQGDSIACANHAYTVVAAMAHLGSDMAGHYRSAMRIQPLILNRTQPIRWLVTDDWMPPQATWNLRSWMQENVTMVWLVRSDLLRLPLYQAPQDQTASSTAELLQMLSETN